MKKGKINLYTFAILALILIFVGCIFLLIGRRDDGILNDREAIQELLKVRSLSDYDDISNNAQIAISKYENKIIDTNPVLIYALLTRPIESDYDIDLLIYHEGEDLLGIGINETYIDSNGLETELIEEYPVFLFLSPKKGAIPWMIPTKIRDSDQIKSEQRWKEYTFGEGIEMDKIWDAEYWTSSLPEVWISIPEPNKVEVEVYLYDKAGNKSKPVKVRHIEVQ